MPTNVSAIVLHGFGAPAGVVRVENVELPELAVHSPVERIDPLGEAAAAVRHAGQSQRAGKILFGAAEIIAHFSSNS